MRLALPLAALGALFGGGARGDEVGRPEELPVVAVTIGKAAPVLGIDHEADVIVRLAGEGPEVRPPRLLCNVGRFEDLVRVGPRAFAARYLFPARHFPQVGVLVAEFAGGRRGHLVVKLRAVTTPAFRTDPGASVTYTVGGREFGPTRAGADGLVRIPIVVPPGVTAGTARSVNRFGKRTEQTFALEPPPFPRLLLASPEALRAGHVEEIAVYAVDPSGAPAESAAIALSTTAERAQPLGGPPGVARFLVRAPASVSAGALTITARLRDQPGTELPIVLPVVAGPAARLELDASAVRGRPPDAPLALVTLGARDAFGNRADPTRAALLVDGRPLSTTPTADARVEALVPASARRGRPYVDLEAVLDGHRATRRLPIPDGRALETGRARLLGVRAGLAWNLHAPPGPAIFAEALGRGDRWPAQLVAGLVFGAARTTLDAADDRGLSRVTVWQLPALAVARARAKAAPRLELGAGAGLGLLLARADARALGATLRGRRVSWAGEAGVEAALRLPAGAAVLGARYLWTRLGRLSSGDRIGGNPVGLLLDVG